MLASRLASRLASTKPPHRSFALQAGSRSGSCPVNGITQASVTLAVVLSCLYLSSHVDAFDAAYAPRSGLHYLPATRSATAAGSAAALGRKFSLSETVSGANNGVRVSSSCASTKASAASPFTVVNELRSAGILAVPISINVLLVPVHPIKRKTFERHVRQLSAFNRIPLADVPADPRGNRAIFSAGSDAPGSLLFDFLTPTTYAASHSLAFLSEFQLHRRVHGIIGIMDASEYANKTLEDALASFQNSLKQLPRMFATKVYGFNPNDAQLEQGRKMKESEGLVMVPSIEDTSFYLYTLIADFASAVLFDFSNMAAQLESRSTISTPQPQPGLRNPFSFVPNKPTAKQQISTYTSPTTPIVPKTQQAVDPLSVGLTAPPQSRTALGLWGGSSAGNQEGYLYGNSIQSNVSVQPGVSPSPPPASSIIDSKSRKRIAGRERKLMGDMWLLAGRLGEAVSCYNEAITLTKTWADQVWQASALEGLAVATVLQAFQPQQTGKGHKRQPSRPRTSTPPPFAPPPDTSTFLSLIPEKLSTAVSLYEKMLPSLGPDQPPPDPDSSHPLVYAEACLRVVQFYMAVWEAGGKIDVAIERLVVRKQDPHASATPEEQARLAATRSLSPSNNVPRSSIASFVSLAYSPYLSSLALPVRLRIVGEIASVFGKIGYRRKESFVLRELAALCAEGVAGKSVETVSRAQAPSPIAEETFDETGEPGHPARPGINPLLVKNQSAESRSIVRTATDATGNDSIVRIAEKVCTAFGIRVVPRARDENQDQRRSLIQGELEATGSARQPRQFGWPALQVGILQDVIRVAEALPDYQSAIRFTITALRALSGALTPVEQYELSQNIPRVFAAANRRGATFELEYWGPTRLLMSLELVPLSSNRVPTEHATSEMAGAEPVKVEATKKDPFIFNPKRATTSAKTRMTIVQNEPVEAFVTLQNTFLFDLEVKSIELSTSGVGFISEPVPTVVPPGSFHTVRLRGTPLEAGCLTVRGCWIQLVGCPSREFLLPVWSEEAETKRQRAEMLDTRRERVKKQGLSAFASHSNGEDDGETRDMTFLECSVVPEMPLMWMRSTSLTHGALMLYDGERTTIRIALENTSPLPVDFVKLSFADSHAVMTEAYLADNEHSASDAYEIESDNLYRPVFSWKQLDGAQMVDAGSSVVLEVQCLGKAGCSNGTANIDYAYVERDAVKGAGVFYTRRLVLDVFMTVHRALVAHTLDIQRLKALPESATTRGRSASVVQLGRKGAALDQRLEDNFKDVDDGEHCLVAIDVMNTFGKPFEVKVQRKEDGRSSRLFRIEPGATLRMLLRLDRFLLPACACNEPIPSLSQRQFVVSKSVQSAQEERWTRELFWYREALLQKIKATWNEVGSLRTGEILLRSLQLTKPMLETLRSDDIEVEMCLQENPAAEPDSFELQGQGQRLVYTAASNEFIDVAISIENNTDNVLDMTVRLDVRPPEAARSPAQTAAHLSRHIIVEGISPTRVPTLQPGQSQRVVLSVCFLSEGEFVIGCVAEERVPMSGEDERDHKTARTAALSRMVTTRAHDDDAEQPKLVRVENRQDAGRSENDESGVKREAEEQDRDGDQDEQHTDKKPKLENDPDGDKPSGSGASKSGELPPDAFSSDMDGDGHRKHGVLEHGHIYFVYKPRVEVEEAHSVDDVAHLHVILAPSHLKQCYRLLTIGRKYLPKRTEGQKQKQSDICWGKVLEVSDTFSHLKQSLGESSYETKTRGTRHVGPGRVAGSGVYLVYSAKAPDAPKNTQNASALYQTYIAYAIGVPHDLGQVQHDLHIEHEGAFQLQETCTALQVKNPSAPSTNPRVRDQPPDKQPKYPKALSDLFTTRYIPANPPALLNYAGAELLFLPSKRAVRELLGEDGEQELQKELEDEAPAAKVKTEDEDDGGHDERSRQEAQEALKAVGLENQIEGKALEGYWE
ncbi:hypothetical protein OIV83_002941 [Microbotryomycetes sp. JL201]|nr:hypothetical protein OIV83_002941 [Microbotryomycetes sp. JL201]